MYLVRSMMQGPRFLIAFLTLSDERRHSSLYSSASFCLLFPFFGWFPVVPLAAALAFESLVLPFGFPVFF
jgi:hypothetical protein